MEFLSYTNKTREGSNQVHHGEPHWLRYLSQYLPPVSLWEIITFWLPSPTFSFLPLKLMSPVPLPFSLSWYFPTPSSAHDLCDLQSTRNTWQLLPSLCCLQTVRRKHEKNPTQNKTPHPKQPCPPFSCLAQPQPQTGDGRKSPFQPHNYCVGPWGDSAPRSSHHAGPGTASNSQGSAEQKDMQFFSQLRSYLSFGGYALGVKGEGRSIQIVR